MPRYHIYPDRMMRVLPGYVSEDAPTMDVPEQVYRKARETLDQALSYCRDQGATHVTLDDIFKMVAGSLIHAGLSKEEVRRIMDTSTGWFVMHPEDWLTTISPVTGRVWLASLPLLPEL